MKLATLRKLRNAFGQVFTCVEQGEPVGFRHEAESIGAKFNVATRVFSLSASTGERAGVRSRSPQLPRTNMHFTSTLFKEQLQKLSEILATLNYDAFGRIYKYSLGEFAMSKTHGDGEYSAHPRTVVHLPTRVIEPYHGHPLEALPLASSRCVNRAMNPMKSRRGCRDSQSCIGTSGGMVVPLLSD